MTVELLNERVKQVLLYRRDLKMRKGKIAAQCAHASTGALLRSAQTDGRALIVPVYPAMATWLQQGCAKVVLSVDDEDALLHAHDLALEAGLPAVLITDAGKTEFHGQPTRTALAIGPARAAEIDLITGPEGAVATRLA